MIRISLRWKVLLYASALLVALIVAMLVYVNYQGERFVHERIGVELEQGRRRILASEEERLADLRLTARLVASFPELKALLAETDIATVRDFLLSYQQANRSPSLLLVLDPHGRTVARTDTPQPLPLIDVETRWVRPALETQSATGILVTSSGVYNAAVVPAEAGGTVFGFVLAASTIDHEFARSLGEASQNEVVLAQDRILGSTIPESKFSWRSRAAWQAALGRERRDRLVEIDGETYVAQSTPLRAQSDSAPLAVILKSRDQALAPYRRIQLGLAALGLIVALAGIGGSAVLARNVTAPIAQLVEGTKQVANGNFDFRTDVRSGDEIGDLGQSFNSMIQGLAERARMQKYISRSAVKMIQESSHKDVSAGERVLLTIFFSDMRGFTAMSEEMRPEGVVNMLNRCLSLQAEIVKKHQGDIDKYVGDCVMALFSGADMAGRAIGCAIEIQQAIEDYNQSNPHEQPLAVGIGVVTGDVVLGSIGSHDRQDFTVVGANVNLCSRLCSIAGRGEILLDELTFHLLQGRIPTEHLEAARLKGFSQPVPVHKVAAS